MPGEFVIRTPVSHAEWNAVRQLLIDYYNEFDDKTCFTSFERELNGIEQLYAEEDKVKLIAVDQENGTVAGCVALRKHADGVSEMKRLYIHPAYRGKTWVGN